MTKTAILGDNINVNLVNVQTNLLNDLLLSYNLTNLVNKSTRVLYNVATISDHCYTRRSNKDSFVVKTNTNTISDHYGLEIKQNFAFYRNIPVVIKKGISLKNNFGSQLEKEMKLFNWKFV
jgi:hypothetical protein